MDCNLLDSSCRKPDRFLVLTRLLGPASVQLARLLGPLGLVEVSADDPRFGGIWYPDDECEKFGGMMSTSGDFPQITSWSRAFLHLTKTLQDGQSVWFVEDDVCSDFESLRGLVNATAELDPDLAAWEVRTIESDPQWPWWNYAKGFFEKPSRGFQPLCRLSHRLIQSAIGFSDTHHLMTFHEVLFPSLARKQEMKIVSWKDCHLCSGYFGTFRYRPLVVDACNGICHPVKDVIVHEKICNSSPTKFPRLGMASSGGNSISISDYIMVVKIVNFFGIRNSFNFGSEVFAMALLDAGSEVRSTSWEDMGYLARLQHCCVVGAPAGEVDLLEVEKAIGAAELALFDYEHLRGEIQEVWSEVIWRVARMVKIVLVVNTGLEERYSIPFLLAHENFVVQSIPTLSGLTVMVNPGKWGTPGSGKAALPPFNGKASGWTWGMKLLTGLNEGGRKILNIGSGGSAGLVCADSWLQISELDVIHDIGFHEKSELLDINSSLHTYFGESQEILGWMISVDGFWESFDIVFIDCSRPKWVVLSDLCQGWLLSNAGAVIVAWFDESDQAVGEGRLAVEAFLSVYVGRAIKMMEASSIVMLKL